MPVATATKVSLYRYTLGLVKALYTNSTFRESFRRALTSGKKNYLGIPLGNHIWVLSKIDYNYRGLLQEYKGFLRGDVKPEEFVENFFDSLKRFYENRLARESLEQEVEKYEAGEIGHPSFVAAEEHAELLNAESLPSEGARVGAMENFTQTRLPQLQTPAIHVPYVPVQGTVHLPGEVTDATADSHLGGGPTLGVPAEAEQKVVVSEHPFTPQSPPVIPAKAGIQIKDSGVVAPAPPQNDRRPAGLRIPSLRSLKLPRLPQGLTLPVGKFIRKNVTVTRVASLFTGTLGAFLGGTTTGTALGAVGGGIAGGVVPSLVKQRGFGNFSLNLASRVGHGSADFIGGISSGGRNLRAGVSRVSRGFTGRKLALLLLLFIFGASLFSLFGFGPQPTQPGQNNVTIRKTTPRAEVGNGEEIPYTITVTYTGLGQANIEVTDQLDLSKVDFVSASEAGVLSGSVVRWILSGVSANQPRNLSLVVKPRQDNIWVVNAAEVRVTSTTGGGTPVAGGSCPTKEAISANHNAPAESCQYFNLGVNIFDTNIPPDQVNIYVNTYWPISRSAFGQNYTEPEFRSRVKAIIDISQRVGLNPVIFLSYWRSESGFANHFGCGPQAGLTSLPFDDSVKCAVGLATPIYPRAFSITARCAAPNINNVMKELSIPFQDSGGRSVDDPRKSACREVYAIRNFTNRDGIHLYTNKEIHDAANYPNDYSAEFPIQTFDDFVESYGTRSPKLVSASNPINGNCKNTYNTLVETVISLNACKASTPGLGTSNLASCSFYRNDQTGRNYDPTNRNENACPTDETLFRCAQGLEYRSPLLLSYIEEAARITTVPAKLLAAIVRLEATTHPAYSATGKLYSISDYTDDDIRAMEQTASSGSIASNIDATIGSTPKALCPRSTTGALGITQIQPPGTTGHDRNSVNNGAKLLNPPKTVDNLTVSDYCNPRTSLVLAGGFILNKLGIPRWNPALENEIDINRLGRLYYGNDEQTGKYASSVWRSVSECRQ